MFAVAVCVMMLATSRGMARDQKRVYRVVEATRDVGNGRTVYRVKVEYRPAAGAEVKKITIKLYENLGPDGRGGFKKGAEKDKKSFPSPPVSANGGTDWFQKKASSANDYLVGVEMEEADGTVTRSPVVRAVKVID
jgi:hypothetical protein